MRGKHLNFSGRSWGFIYLLRLSNTIKAQVNQSPNFYHAFRPISPAYGLYRIQLLKADSCIQAWEASSVPIEVKGYYAPTRSLVIACKPDVFQRFVSKLPGLVFANAMSSRPQFERPLSNYDFTTNQINNIHTT